MQFRQHLSFVALLGLVACATPGPYAEIDGKPVGQTDIENEPVLITGAGTEMMMRPTTSAVLSPGKQLIEVMTTRKSAFIKDKRATLALDAKPCMRYFVVAKHPVGANPNDWYVQVVKEEPIGECKLQPAKP